MMSGRSFIFATFYFWSNKTLHFALCAATVSYTHLTLPTILLV